MHKSPAWPLNPKNHLDSCMVFNGLHLSHTQQAVSGAGSPDPVPSAEDAIQSRHSRSVDSPYTQGGSGVQENWQLEQPSPKRQEEGAWEEGFSPSYFARSLFI